MKHSGFNNIIAICKFVYSQIRKISKNDQILKHKIWKFYTIIIRLLIDPQIVTTYRTDPLLIVPNKSSNPSKPAMTNLLTLFHLLLAALPTRGANSPNPHPELYIHIYTPTQSRQFLEDLLRAPYTPIKRRRARLASTNYTRALVAVSVSKVQREHCTFDALPRVSHVTCLVRIRVINKSII